MNDMVQILNLVTQGGAVVLLALLGFGLYKLARDTIPAVKDFFSQLVTSLGALQARVAVIETKVDATNTAVSKGNSDATSAIGRVTDTVQAEAFEVKQELGATERRLAAVIRREQVSDPPPAVPRVPAATPATGIPIVSRRPTGA